jgi:fructose-bisphosphate aldolase class 1
MERSYRPKLPYENAIAELQLVAGTQLDRDLVEIFCAIPRMKVVACMDDVKKRMEKYKIGTFR